MAVLLATLLLLATSDVGASGVSRDSPAVDSLTIEYLDNPLGVDVLPRFSWRVHPPAPQQRGLAMVAYRVQVSSDAFATFAWDSKRVNSSSTRLIRYNGSALVSDTRYSVRVMSWLSDGSTTAFGSASFHTGLLVRSDWAATWVTGGDNATLLRKEFELAKPPRAYATLFVAGIGYSEVELDGQAVSDSKLGSGWTDYSKRVVYSTFDVTELVRDERSVAAA